MRRRVFLFLMAIECCCASLALDAAERPNVPKDLLFERKPLAADLNAFTEWQEAGKCFVGASSEIKDIMAKAWSRKGEQVSPNEAQAVQNWISTNRLALEWLEKSLRKERAQIPVFKPDDVGPFLTPSHELAKARLFLADQAAIKGDQTTATHLLLGNFKLAQMLERADVPLLHYLVARGIRSSTEKATVRWADRSNTPPTVIRTLLKKIPELDDAPDICARAIRVESSEFDSVDMDLKGIQKKWLDATRTNDMALALIPEELQRPLFIVHDPLLIASHPKPNDCEENTRIEWQRFRKFILYARSSWRPGDQEGLKLETAHIREQFLKDIQPLLEQTANETVPLNPKAAEKAIKYYRKLVNPVGRFWRSNGDILLRTYVAVFQSRTERSATRALLALRIYELEHNTRAQSLEDLVKADLLDHVATDFFANAPLHYSPEKGILWSVGEDGVDNGGVAGLRQWMEKDAVWKLPQP